MNVYYDIKNLPFIKNPVVTIGTFDGVHKGHCKIIRQLKEQTKKYDGESVIITFAQHPRNIIKQSDGVLLLNETDEKIKLFQQEGVDNVIIIDFSESFFSQSAQEYIENFLVKNLHPSCIIVGYDHKFGKNRSGNYLMLEEYGKKHHFTIKEIDAEVVKDIAVSSTKIREALLKGEIKMATELLGYHYFFTGKVVQGNRLGRNIGFPTANLHLQNPQKLIPQNGVYAVYVHLEGQQKKLKGMLNIGVRPTIDGRKKTIEVNIFDFDKDIYGANVTIEVVKFLRDEKKFLGIEQLKEQLIKDKAFSLQVL